VLESVTGVVTAGLAAAVTLQGSGFTKTSAVRIGGTDDLATDWVSDAELTATVGEV
jgi:hypothetical protein